jgi:lauroyl/myristoyl acyltransferase
MFEMFLIVLPMRYWSKRTMHQRVKAGESCERFFTSIGQDQPSVLFVPHTSMTEAMAVLPQLEAYFPPSVTLYRNLDHPVVDAFVKESREFAGNVLLSRRDGLLKAKKHLQSGRNCAVILFDQSAGFNGHLSLFFDRLCSTSNLPALLAAKTDAAVAVLHLRRERFWKGTVETIPVPSSKNPADILIAVNKQWEQYLRSGDEQCADWFWAHKRWKATLRPNTVLNLKALKSYLPQEYATRGIEAPPRLTRIALRLDPRPELLPAANRFAALIRKQRPDAQIWLLAPESLESTALPEHDRCFILSEEKSIREQQLDEINQAYPDALFVLDPSAAAVSEAKRIQCDSRSGLTLDSPPRRSYHTHLIVEDDLYLQTPSEVLLDFGMQFGLDREELLTHFKAPSPLA